MYVLVLMVCSFSPSQQYGLISESSPISNFRHQHDFRQVPSFSSPLHTRHPPLTVIRHSTFPSVFALINQTELSVFLIFMCMSGSMQWMEMNDEDQYCRYQWSGLGRGSHAGRQDLPARSCQHLFSYPRSFLLLFCALDVSTSDSACIISD